MCGKKLLHMRINRRHLQQYWQQDDPYKVEQPGRGSEDDVIISHTPAPPKELQAGHGAGDAAAMSSAAGIASLGGSASPARSFGVLRRAG